jgi:hypothetical protein
LGNFNLFNSAGVFRKNLPLALFLWLVAVQTLLSYGALSLLNQLWIGLVGFGLPLTVFVLKIRSNPAPPTSTQLEVFPNIFPLICFFIPVALLFRFGWLVSFHHWPFQDDALHAFLAMDLVRHWRWDPFLTFTQTPPLHIWWESLFFRFLKPSLETFWLGPAVLSTLTAILSYACARAWFNKNESLWLTLLWSASFWPAFSQRFCTEPFLFWELCALGGLGFWKRTLGTKNEFIASSLYGFCLGAGAWTHYHWFLSMPIFLFAAYLISKGRFKILFVLSLSALVPFLPLLFAGLFSSWGFYLFMDLGTKHDFGLFSHILEGLRYLAAVFWGSSSGGYRPFWGGFLNPIFGSLVLIGIWKAPSYAGKSGALFIYSFLLSGLLPGFLLSPTEYLRMIHMLPFLILTAFFGLKYLFETIDVSRRIVFWGSLLFLSSGLDITHLLKMREAWAHPNLDWSLQAKSPARARAFEVLKLLQNGEKGWVLTNLAPNPEDFSLGLAGFSWSPSDSQSAQWIALLLEKSWAQALLARHPLGCVFPLGENPSKAPGQELALFYLRKSGFDNPDFANDGWVEQWRLANEAFTNVIRDSLQFKEGRKRLKILKDLLRALPTTRQDAVLESLMWFRISEFYKNQIIVVSYNRRLLNSHPLAPSNAAFLAKRIEALRHSYALLPTTPVFSLLQETEATAKILRQNRVPCDFSALSDP